MNEKDKIYEIQIVYDAYAEFQCSKCYDIKLLGSYNKETTYDYFLLTLLNDYNWIQEGPYKEYLYCESCGKEFKFKNILA